MQRIGEVREGFWHWYWHTFPKEYSIIPRGWRPLTHLLVALAWAAFCIVVVSLVLPGHHAALALEFYGNPLIITGLLLMYFLNVYLEYLRFLVESIRGRSYPSVMQLETLFNECESIVGGKHAVRAYWLIGGMGMLCFLIGVSMVVFGA
jgi:hypothetical protein